ncbi:Smr/MutS family protein [Arenicellales bacterium nBUS_48]
MKKIPRRRTSISKDEVRLFREAVSGVQPFSQQPRVNSRPVVNKKRLKHFNDVPQKPIISEDGESFRRVNIDLETFSALKAGKFNPEDVLDLHGNTVDKAMQRLSDFINQKTSLHQTCQLVITGKGSHSPEGFSPVRNSTLGLMPTFPQVVAFCWATPSHGGSGAFFLLIDGSQS